MLELPSGGGGHGLFPSGAGQENGPRTSLSSRPVRRGLSRNLLLQSGLAAESRPGPWHPGHLSGFLLLAGSHQPGSLHKEAGWWRERPPSATPTAGCAPSWSPALACPSQEPSLLPPHTSEGFASPGRDPSLSSPACGSAPPLLPVLGIPNQPCLSRRSQVLCRHPQLQSDSVAAALLVCSSPRPLAPP